MTSTEERAAWPPPTAIWSPPAATPARFSHVLRSEWTKLRTLRSTFFTLLVAVVLVVGMGALVSFEASSHYRITDGLWDPTQVSLSALNIGQLAIAVLGVLAITAEYSTGMIRTSLAAVPRRGRLLAGKGLVFGALAVVTGEVLAWAAFFLGQAVISGHQPTAQLGAPGVARAVFGAGLYVALVGLMSVALGTIIRHTAGAIVTVVAILFVLPGVVLALPESWRNPIEKYWPTQAGSQILQTTRAAHTLAPWAGFADLVIFVALLFAIAAYLLKRRDA